MKLTVLALLLSILGSWASQGYSQTTRLNLEAKNVTIEEFLRKIEDQSEYRFFYSGKIDVERTISGIFKNKLITEVLDDVLKNSNIRYEMKGRQIILSPAETSSSVNQQQKSISGKVTDSTGASLPGVTVVVKGTTTGTITDANGNYSLSNVPENATLQFSFVGMKAQEIKIGNQSSINVVLVEETVGIEEVVAVGYGTQKKTTLTGSVSNIKSEELTKRPVANSSELLQGQIAGLITRQTTGIPGGDGTTLSIRGYGNSLILIDGIEGSIADIDPNDIESISVLKDASASVYGARAGNGVILVTTKRGKEQPSKIEYHGSFSVTQPTFLPTRVNVSHWAELLSEVGLNPDDFSPNSVAYDPETKQMKNTLDGTIYEGTNWTKALYRNWTPQQQHNMSASGGTKKIKYFISGGFTDQASNFKSGDYNFNRYNLRSNIDAMITDNLSVSFDIAYRSTILDKANFILGNMYTALRRAKPSYPVIIEQDPSKASYAGFLQSSPYYQTFKEYSGFINNKENTIQGAIELKYSFPMIKGLSAKARLNYEDIYSWDKNVSKPFEVYEYDLIAENAGANPWIVRGIENINNMTVFANRSSELLPLVSLEYDRSFGNHNFKAFLGSETKTYKFTSLTGSRKNILSYNAPYLRYASEDGKDNTEGTDESARSSVIGRVNYDYKSKYILEFAMRADASAEYPTTSRWGYFPSVSMGWRISEEPFLKNNFKYVDNLKLRASYGILGNDAISSFDYLTGYNITSNFYVFGTTPAPIISSAGLANPNITWETMKITNFGLDGSFWEAY